MPKNADPATLIEPQLVAALTDLAFEAAAAVLAFWRGAIAVREKPDRSPVTAADEASETVILRGLARLMPGIAVVSEEHAADVTRLDSPFVLVDPLDGTREFLAGRDEFTVNIAVIAEGVAVAGVIAAPALGSAWRGIVGRGAQQIPKARALPVPIRARGRPAANAVALVSRSHLDPASEALLHRLGDLDRRPCGSALKFCRLAEGSADFYPRLAPTGEWDIAAGHALLIAAGGAMAAPDGSTLTYGHVENGFLVPAFVAAGDPAVLQGCLPGR